MKAITKHIPNAITSMNLLSGCVAIVFALKGYPLWAGYCIYAAAIFDFCDGLSARALKAYSPLGVQLDSLADMVSFGVAPSAILYSAMNGALATSINGDLSTLGWELLAFFPFFIAVFSALRLAKFNIDTRQTESFIGLPTPANALLICSAIMFSTTHSNLDWFFQNPWVIVGAVVMLSFLLVCELPMFSFKFKNLRFKDNLVRFLFIAAIVVLFIVFRSIPLTLALAILLYILLSAALSLVCKGPKPVAKAD